MNEKQKIIIIDDEALNIKKLSLILEPYFQLYVATNGEKGIKIIKENKPDLILLDIVMPELDGYEVCKLLKSDKSTSEIPIIFVTGQTKEDHEELGFELGAIDYIKKPYNPKIVLSRINIQLKLRQQKIALESINKKNEKYLNIIDKYVISASTDLEGNIINVSQQFCKTTGYDKLELIGKKHSILKSGHIKDNEYAMLWNCLTNENFFQGEFHDHKKDGSDFWLDSTILADYDENGNKKGYTSISFDITMEKLYKGLSQIDKLTKLYNRAKLDKVLENEFKRNERYNDLLSIIMLDIDHFKLVNDTYGHQVGDSVLIELAELLKENIRHCDRVGRWGGEEFVIVCPQTDINAAIKVAEKIRVIVEKFDFKYVEKVTLSFGVAQLKNDESLNKLIQKADKALYKAKNSGRNCVMSNS